MRKSISAVTLAARQPSADRTGGRYGRPPRHTTSLCRESILQLPGMVQHVPALAAHGVGTCPLGALEGNGGGKGDHVLPHEAANARLRIAEIVLIGARHGL